MDFIKLKPSCDVRYIIIHVTLNAAFSAYTLDFYYKSNGDVIRFDGIYDEYGPGFNDMVGFFVCPTHGIYQFSASIIQSTTSVEATVRKINILISIFHLLQMHWS